MKVILPFLMSVFMSFSTSSSFRVDNTLTVVISNIKTIEGDIEIGIFQDSDDFPHEGSQMYKLRIPVTQDSIEVVFPDLRDGDYAIVLFHDINNDGLCNMNFIGYPKEPYGFSNNKRPFFRTPSFNATKFNVTGDKKIYIKLIS
jgi:uncharacterized protein (DUF2141 family)